jgi:hypothetical protein
MDGYDVVTFDEHKVGHVVGRSGPFIVVEHGAVFKHRRPVPETFATVDESERIVRITISKEILESAPEVKDGELDERAAAEHYGLVTPSGAETADDDSLDGMPSARDELEQEERAERMSHLSPGQGPDDAPLPSPGVTGGDRRRDAD